MARVSAVQMTASLPLPPATDDFERPTSLCVTFKELTQVWVIDHSVVLDQSTYPVSTYVIPNLPVVSLSTAGY